MLNDLLTPRLRPGLDTSIPATAPVKNIGDVLSDFVPGQRILAEIQALLPNGAYRAMVGQRELTLALPFSAKAGDSLELEVRENDGKLVLAVVRDKAASEGASIAQRGESAATTLSNTGRLISDLLGEVTRDSKRPAPLLLNGNQPLMAPATGEAVDTPQLAASLRQSLAQSGMFYEAHQARWVQGSFPETQLRQEPQGLLSSIPPRTEAPPPEAGGASTASTNLSELSGEASAFRRASMPDDQSTIQIALKSPYPAEQRSETLRAPTSDLPLSSQENRDTGRLQQPPPSSPLPLPGGMNEVHRDTIPIVQQQLDALATQQFVWQGQAWPGQPMHWEIAEEQQRQGGGLDDDDGRRWRTRLRLELPQLGGIDATLQLLPGGEVRIRMIADSTAGENSLREASGSLLEQYRNAGLSLSQLQIDHELPETLTNP